MSDTNVIFRMIPVFVSQNLKNLFEVILKKASSIAQLSSPEFLCDGEVVQDANIFIPLVLCDERSTIQKKGVFCPYEFVLERNDLLPLLDGNGKGKIISKPEEILVSRLLILAKLYGKMKPKKPLQDWFAGAFRMYLMLDATTHGTPEFIDLLKGRDDPILQAASRICSEDTAPKSSSAYDLHAFCLMKRFCGEAEAEDKPFKQLAQWFFNEQVKRLESAFVPSKKETERLDELISIYVDTEHWPERCDERCEREGKPREHTERLPVAFGERGKYVTPSGKLNLLLIDDKVEESPFGSLKEEKGHKKFSSSISQDDWELLRDLFNVEVLPIDETGDIYENARRCFQKFQKEGLTYDLILVDLCLGNNRREDDLAGYTIIRIVKEFFPGTPIVVYSRFSDMEHIARAFASGAKWFLVKGEEAKLPRHVLKLLRQVSWDREWRSIQNSSNSPIWNGDESSSFYQKFQRTPQWKYLTYKSLESFPGRFISLKKMGGGISSAVTFKATKGVKLGDDFLQTPSIIKIDASNNTMMEYERYFRMIRPYIANEVGRVEMPERFLNRKYSSIVYTFAGKQDPAHTLESMGNMLDDDVACLSACDYERYRYALTLIFDEILPKVHRVSPELEQGDIDEGRGVQRFGYRDAFAWTEEWWSKAAHMSSFPNPYFRECPPWEFWKSYVQRMQPWGCFSIDDVVEDAGEKRLFLTQPTNGEKKKRLAFHDVLTDPFATIESGKGGRQLIEAYTADRKLVWLSGAVSDFMARFRTRVAPETSLWLGEADWLDENGELKKGMAGEWDGKSASTGTDGRLEWLKKVFDKADKDRHRQDQGQKQPSAGDDFFQAITELKCVSDLGNAKEPLFYVELQDAIIDIAKKTAKGKAKEWGMRCPVGIIHGDLNVANIMLESRKHPPKEENPDVTHTVSDVWLIDFARTRRDLIAHDFNVFFTSVLSKLFAETLIGKEDEKPSAHQEVYWTKLIENFQVIVSAAVKPLSQNAKGVPDEIKDDRRFTLIYRILRRTHDAALAAGVSQNMYLLTTALVCLYTVKIFLEKGCKVRLAAGFFAATWICYDLLCKELEIDNVKTKNKEKQS